MFSWAPLFDSEITLICGGKAPRGRLTDGTGPGAGFVLFDGKSEFWPSVCHWTGWPSASCAVTLLHPPGRSGIRFGEYQQDSRGVDTLDWDAQSVVCTHKDPPPSCLSAALLVSPWHGWRSRVCLSHSSPTVIWNKQSSPCFQGLCSPFSFPSLSHGAWSPGTQGSECPHPRIQSSSTLNVATSVQSPGGGTLYLF